MIDLLTEIPAYLIEHRSLVQSYVLRQLSAIYRRWPTTVKLRDQWESDTQRMKYKMCSMERIEEDIIKFDNQSATLHEFVNDWRDIVQNHLDTLEPANLALALKTVRDVDAVMNIVS